MPISPKLRPLLEPEREKAWELARERTAGPLPDAEMFKSNQLSKYPPWMIKVVTILALIVLAAAFLPSAYRLHAAGYTTFCETMQQDHLCDQVGYATVLLAEIGQVIFLLCIAVLSRSIAQTRMFMTGAIASTLIALFGNAYVSNPWLHGGYIFAYIEAFAPPGIVFLLGYALKELLLHFIEERRATGVAIKKAEIERITRYNDPEKQPEWFRHYSIALRDAIRKANARYKPELLALTNDDWQHIIKHEMLAGQYTVDPTKETAIERQVREAQAEALRLADEARTKALQAPPSERKQLLEELPAAIKDQVTASVTDAAFKGDDEVWLTDPQADPATGFWTAYSKYSKKVLATDLPNEKAARKRVHDYNYRWQRRNQENT